MSRKLKMKEPSQAAVKKLEKAVNNRPMLAGDWKAVDGSLHLFVGGHVIGTICAIISIVDSVSIDVKYQIRRNSLLVPYPWASCNSLEEAKAILVESINTDATIS